MSDWKMSRRDFMTSAALAAGGLAAGCCGKRALAPQGRASSFDWGCLLHLGSNMWDDYAEGPDDWAKSEEEEAVRPNPIGPEGKKRSGYRSYVRCHDDIWKRSVDHAAKAGMNLVFVDLGEAVLYPSHPELAVAGTWSVEKIRKELDRMRALGLEPCPKLNFSACHDSWLKDYHRMLSTAKYYQVVGDVIRDAIEIFDGPRLFHIGYDEEMPVAEANHFHMTVRQGDLWWHDVNYTIDQVSRHGVRPVMWADAIWTGRANFLKRMTKEVLLSNWYYRSDFSPKKLQWDYAFEKRGGWGELYNGAAAFQALEEGGFDQLPFTSNWAEDASADAVVKFCKEHISPSRLKGFCTASWKMSIPDDDKKKNISATLSAIDLLAQARARYYAR